MSSESVTLIAVDSLVINAMFIKINPMIAMVGA